MKKRTLCMIPILLFTLASVASAKDTLGQFNLKQALKSEKVHEAIHHDISLYWGNQAHPRTIRKYGTYVSSRRTSAFGKSKETACQWALASAIKSLQDRATREGGNAVVNITSFIKDQVDSSTTHFKCLQGSVMVNVALRGTVVKLAK